jgi:phosphoglycerate dehydrogenase-like enzyme
MENQPIELLITLPLPEEVLAPVRELGSRINLSVHSARRSEDVPDELWKKIEVLYTDRVLPLPDQAPNLRWLQFHSAGIDFALESPLLQKEGLKVTNLSGAAAPQAAEYCLTVMLAVAHHLPDLFVGQTKAEWLRERWDKLQPRELRGSTVGMIGYGSIGRELARLLGPFGVTVLAAKLDAMHPEDDGYFAEGLGDPHGNLFTRLYPYQAVRSMIKHCDFIVVSVPLTPATRGMFGAEELAVVKPGAFLVVVGRGGVVDETALLEALEDKHLAGAALDVFAEEPLAPTSPLWKAPNMLVTPHVAGMSALYNQRAMLLFTANLRRYLTGAPLYNLYDPKRGY